MVKVLESLCCILVVVFLSSIKSWTEFTRLQFKEICDCAVFPDTTSGIQNVLLNQTNSLIRSLSPCPPAIQFNPDSDPQSWLRAHT